MSYTPIVSVVMSVYNGEPYLHDAIVSILEQTLVNFEFIIVNDGSTDKSFEIIKSFEDERIILINQQNAGLAKALNKGIRIAKGKYIARMDADDICIKNRLELQVEYMENNPDCVVVGSNAKVIDQCGNYVYTTKLPIDNDQLRKLLPSSPFVHSSVLMRKEAVEKCNFYYEEISNLYSFEDVILWNKICHQGKLANIKIPLIRYRLQPFAVTSKTGTNFRIYEILNKIIERGFILDNEVQILKNIKLHEKSFDKIIKYHLHLAKKYLWNNYQPKLARENLFKVIKKRKNILSAYFLFFISYLPQNVIDYLYKKAKTIKSKKICKQ